MRRHVTSRRDRITGRFRLDASNGFPHLPAPIVFGISAPARLDKNNQSVSGTG
jgi:hypothetical protein